MKTKERKQGYLTLREMEELKQNYELFITEQTEKFNVRRNIIEYFINEFFDTL